MKTQTIQTYLSLIFLTLALTLAILGTARECFISPKTIQKAMWTSPQLNNAALVAVSESFKGVK